MTVTGESPIIDVRSNTLGTNFGKELLEAIPSARDPWVILEQTPGHGDERAERRRQRTRASRPASARTAAPANQQWNLDGATITDMAAGSSPTYFDFDSFEEIQITTAGGDASQEASGVAINFVTKSGGNQLKGSGRVVRRQQGAPVDEHAGRSGGAGRRRRQSAEGRASSTASRSADRSSQGQGLVLGRDQPPEHQGRRPRLPQGGRAGGVDRRRRPRDRHDRAQQPEPEVELRWTRAHKTTFLYQRGDKVRNARGANSTTRIEATNRQTGPTNYYKAEHQWVASDRLMLEAEYSYNNAGFLLDFHEDDLATVQRLSYVDQGDTFDALGDAQRQHPADLRVAPRRQLLPAQLPRRRSLDQVRRALAQHAVQDDQQDRRRRDRAHPLDRRSTRSTSRATATPTARCGSTRCTSATRTRWSARR